MSIKLRLGVEKHLIKLLFLDNLHTKQILLELNALKHAKEMEYNMF